MRQTFLWLPLAIVRGVQGGVAVVKEGRGRGQETLVDSRSEICFNSKLLDGFLFIYIVWYMLYKVRQMQR